MHEILAWNPEDKTYRMIYADAFTPSVTVASGGKDDGSIVFERSESKASHVRVARSVIRDIAADSFVMESSVSVDRAPFRRTLVLSFTRRAVNSH